MIKQLQKTHYQLVLLGTSLTLFLSQFFIENNRRLDVDVW